ncbi:hypothetical protein FA95DRAFT_697000 [Auriscalpium vulgare]|uniref:Uncharacterized protein n=1 Tax=Auriscalpium vulgare TaxID=40419 RepID=A0ACB8RBM5_9AGAM|nr:hypothetical protein FA95DRAFT_697000 [Auriscalpium vulgare]
MARVPVLRRALHHLGLRISELVICLSLLVACKLSSAVNDSTSLHIILAKRYVSQRRDLQNVPVKHEGPGNDSDSNRSTSLPASTESTGVTASGAGT